MPMLAGSATRPGLLALSRQRQAVAGLQQRCAGRTRLGSQHVARSTARPFAQQSQRFLSQSRQCAHAQLSKPRATEDKKQLFTSTKEEPASSEPPPPPPPPPKRRVGILGWLKRGVLFIAVGSTSALAYGIWHGRNPAEQLPPDPTKKTLVILGTGWGTVSLLKSLNTENYNVIVISPRNYFLFTPLLPSCTTGLIEHRSIMEPIRAVLRHKKGAVTYYEAKATRIDPVNRIVHMEADSEVSTANRPRQVPYDVLVVGVGATTSTFGIPGVQEHSCFLKEVADAQNIRKRIMDLIETSMYRGQSEEDLRRLLHMVVVGGGPTGVEFAGELQDFFNDDLRKWIPDIQGQFHVTLVEALPNRLRLDSAGHITPVTC
ncbi:NADH:ubiquinone oxidoreductase [Ascosphaera acerosa]|nr:NADH:ubiquinone oxidoreductase [Ascosphaera acerosa]